jgi:hypothetical protein
MRRSKHNTLINLGRKAGLRTSELYSALASGRAATKDAGAGRTDGNGITTGLDAQGHPVFRPDSPGRAA